MLLAQKKSLKKTAHAHRQIERERANFSKFNRDSCSHQWIFQIEMKKLDWCASNECGNVTINVYHPYTSSGVFSLSVAMPTSSCMCERYGFIARKCHLVDFGCFLKEKRKFYVDSVFLFNVPKQTHTHAHGAARVEREVTRIQTYTHTHMHIIVYIIVIDEGIISYYVLCVTEMLW